MNHPIVAALLIVLAWAPTATAQISTDRPGFGSSTAPVGRGVLQAEFGIADGSVIFSNSERSFFGSYGILSQSIALRFGLIDLVELRAATISSRFFVPLSGNAEGDAEAGFDAFTFGAKVALPLPTESGATSSVQVEMHVSTEGAPSQLSAELNLSVPISPRLVASQFVVVQRTFLDAGSQDDPDHYLVAANVAFVASETTTLYVEAGNRVADASEGLFTLGFGSLFQIAPTAQVDIGVQKPFIDTGLFGNPFLLNVYLGFSFRTGS